MEPVLPPTRRFNTEETGRLDVLVARALSLSRNQAATLIAAGRVLVSGRTEKASFLAPLGTEVIVSVPVSEARELLPEDIAISVVFEDEEMLVVDKAAGMVVHPAPGNWTGTLVNALMGRGQALADGGGGDERAGLVHRLDKETSGLMIVAKTDRAHRILAKAISEKRIIRRYAALSWGHLTDDFISVDKAIARDPANRLRMAVKEAGRAAKTDFYRIARFMSPDPRICRCMSPSQLP